MASADLKVVKKVEGTIDVTAIRYVDAEELRAVLHEEAEKVYIEKCGDTDISQIGDGTLTGGLKSVNDALADIVTYTEGFIDKDIVFNADGSITETTSEGTRTYVFEESGSILETYNHEGTIKKKRVTFLDNGNIQERVVNS